MQKYRLKVYGDDWMFAINVQKIERTQENFAPIIVKSKGTMTQYPDWDDEDDF